MRTVVSGTELCRIDGKTYKVSRTHPLIVNHDEYCERLGDSGNIDENFIFFWGRSAVGQIFLSHALPWEKTLDMDWENFTGNIRFNHRLDSGHEKVMRLMEVIVRETRRLNIGDDGEVGETVEDYLWALLKTLFLIQNGLSDQIGDIRSVRAPCRIEMIRRLLIAKEFADSCYGTRINVSDMAEVAGFSRYHFMRLFKSLFKLSPQQYIINKKLERAGQLLLNTSKAISEIALEIGLENQSHFIKIFKSFFSVTPGEFRKMAPGNGWDEKLLIKSGIV